MLQNIINAFVGIDRSVINLAKKKAINIEKAINMERKGQCPCVLGSGAVLFLSSLQEVALLPAFPLQ